MRTLDWTASNQGTSGAAAQRRLRCTYKARLDFAWTHKYTIGHLRHAAGSIWSRRASFSMSGKHTGILQPGLISFLSQPGWCFCPEAKRIIANMWGDWDVGLHAGGGQRCQQRRDYGHAVRHICIALQAAVQIQNKFFFFAPYFPFCCLHCHGKIVNCMYRIDFTIWWKRITFS